MEFTTLLPGRGKQLSPPKKKNLADGACLQLLPSTTDPMVLHTALDLTGTYNFQQMNKYVPIKKTASLGISLQPNFCSTFYHRKR